MNNPLATFYGWQVSSGALDGWKSYHIAAGLFIGRSVGSYYRYCMGNI